MQLNLRRVFDGHDNDCVRVGESHFLIGRSDACQLRPVSPLVSRRHCEIIVDHRHVTVRDLASTNGTFVNFQRVKGTQELYTGDVLNIGLAFYEVQILETSVDHFTGFTHLLHLSSPREQQMCPFSAQLCP